MHRSRARAQSLVVARARCGRSRDRRIGKLVDSVISFLFIPFFLPYLDLRLSVR